MNRLGDAVPPQGEAERALREARRTMREVQDALVGASESERSRVWPLVRWLRKAEAGALLALRKHPAARPPRAAARRALRSHGSHRKGSPSARSGYATAAHALLDASFDGEVGEEDEVGASHEEAA